jgi:hypothetical protein
MVRAVAAAVAVALVVAVPAVGKQPRRPALKLDALAPLRVAGRDFAPREAVLLRYVAAGGTSRVTASRATPQGLFRAVFPVRLGRCDSFTVRATGTAGSRAVLQVERRCDDAKGPPKRAPRTPRKPRG